MKRQDLEQLRQKSKADLLEDVKQCRKEIVELRVSRYQSASTNLRERHALKIKLAQILTLVGDKKKV
jgi:ribosomal protein L29